MTRALIDTNIIIDIACERQPFYADSARVFELIDEEKLQVFLSATIVTDIYYLLRKELGKQETFLFLKDLLQVAEVLAVDSNIILKALYSESLDFEDEVQTRVALENEVDIIITRNTKDYNDEIIKALSPKEFLDSVQ